MWARFLLHLLHIGPEDELLGNVGASASLVSPPLRKSRID